jgi:hypothetical protein
MKNGKERDKHGITETKDGWNLSMKTSSGRWGKSTTRQICSLNCKFTVFGVVFGVVTIQWNFIVHFRSSNKH